MSTYIPTSDTSRILQLDVREDGSGWLTYWSGSTTECTATRVGAMLAGAEFRADPLAECPAYTMARVTGSVGCDYTNVDGQHRYDRATRTCSLCYPAPGASEGAHEEAHVALNRTLAFALVRAGLALAESPNDIEKVDEALAAAKAIEALVYA